jgi:hypothetical protein
MKQKQSKNENDLSATPIGKDDKFAKFQTGLVNFGNLKSKQSEIRDEGFRILREADVILGGSSEGHRALFYGAECMEEIANGKIDETIEKKMALVGMAAEEFDQQAEELRKIVVELKGSCCYKSNAQDAADWYMFTRNGNIIYYADGAKHGMVLAHSRSMAEEYVAWCRKNHGDRLSIAKIGTAPGETLQGLLAETFKAGANCAFVLRSLNDTGGLFDVLLPPGQADTP